MALATRCPHCQTTFRVAHDQLKLRAGMVRCGSCQQIFNGIEHLVPLNAGAPAQVADTQQPAAELVATISDAAPVDQAPSTDDEPSLAVANDITARRIDPAPTFEAAPLIEAVPPVSWAEEIAPPASAPEPEMEPEPERPITGDDLYFSTELPAAIGTPAIATETEIESVQAEALGELSETGDESLAEENPASDVEESAATVEDDNDLAARKAEAELAAFVEEPEFVKRGRRKQKLGRTIRIAMAISVFFLLAGLFLQSAYTFRNVLAATWPQSKPVLMQGCVLIGCQVGLPAQIDALSIEPNDRALLTLDKEKTLFEFNVLIRNHSTMPQAWPDVELTLNDVAGKAVVRRVFKAREFPLPPQELAKGIAPNSEQSIKLFFKMSQLKASGYGVQIFYL